MTEDDGFLARWSRRKRRAEPARDEEKDRAEQEAREAVDLAALPALDQLGADSDYTVFLRKGVPAALRNAALRRAWASDPAIANYRTPAEYDWDCNAPSYACLRPTDDAKRMTDALFRHLRETEEKPAEAAEAGVEPPGRDQAGVTPSPEDSASPAPLPTIPQPPPLPTSPMRSARGEKNEALPRP